jgi:type II secretory pathway pseudopilin PulG
MINMNWIIVAIVIIGLLIVNAINNYSKTNVNIANRKAEIDYYNSLSDQQKAAYHQQKALEYQKKLEYINQKNINRLYTMIYDKLKEGKNDKRISEDKYIIQSASRAGIEIEGADTIRNIRVSKDFITSTGIIIKYKNLLDAGFDDKKIRHKLMFRAKIRYSEEEIRYIRENIVNNKGTRLSSWSGFNESIDDSQNRNT